MKAPELGIKIGVHEHGKRNSIADLGVKVGHTTLIEGSDVRTGVTVLLPPVKNPYRERLFASTFVMNGFSKPIGFVQVNELGYIETPIALTNTLSVYTVASAMIKHMIELNPDLKSVSPVVMECNDSYLNNIRKMAVKEEHYFEAVKNASLDFGEGAVGAGTGMSAFEFKGGIGSSSRVVEISGEEYTVASLVLVNFGKREDLTVAGVPIGLELRDYPGRGSSAKGSISMVVTTDAPLTARQLKRLAKRAVVGLARTGGYAYHGSGDVVLAFSTAQTVPLDKEPHPIGFLPDNALSRLFKATAEATEEAIINALLQAKTVEGNGHVRYALPVEKLLEIMERYGRLEKA
ncbi:DmpA family aminopeptidase [Thermococcus gammatolerans]|uniref:Peptidase S58, L-aminopeptidase D-Ala-esterase/amidase DmpA (DmpA) n=1 Tax=Thermococcus gammatolerans (strain DSM 15229 / JCM 11827 / EJ3) TaxID=593117 RepID=C5A6T5_THEGJ|nr:P1 family peptidase [Thermococcus gammatolerans]ACS33947.1 Peptidase S58, L-aminopeptidase D-Ala-esterase/amidase DmpA (DmpA) [Thermococcus gammatolerans EJ3]